MDLVTVPRAVVAVAVAAATVTDVRSFRIPNVVTYPLILSGLPYHAAAGGLEGLVASGLGMLIGCALLAPGYWLGGHGAGDVKLMAGVGAWLGPGPTCVIFLATSLAAGAYAAVLVARGGPGVRRWRLVRMAAPSEQLDWAVRAADRRRVIPYAAMVAVGVILAGVREVVRHRL